MFILNSTKLISSIQYLQLIFTFICFFYHKTKIRETREKRRNKREPRPRNGFADGAFRTGLVAGWSREVLMLEWTQLLSSEFVSKKKQDKNKREEGIKKNRETPINLIPN